MPQPQDDWTLIDYEYNAGLLVARYEKPDGCYEFQVFSVPEGTLSALVAALLVHAGQDERTDILRAEIARNDAVMAKRYAAMPTPDWLPAAERNGNTLR